MVAIYSYDSAGLDMTQPQLPASAADLNSVSIFDYTDEYLAYQVDIAGKTVGAVFEGYSFQGTAPRVTDFWITDSAWNDKIYIGEVTHSLSEFSSLFANNLPELLKGADEIYGDIGNDTLVGYRGADDMWGDAGDDVIYAGNGGDEIWGDSGSDTLFGGFGANEFLWEDDGAVDDLVLKSDQYAYNWVYGSSGNSPNGEKADTIYELDSFDRIWVQGVDTNQLSFGRVNDGIGIFANGTLEATYIGSNLNVDQISRMTFSL